MRRRSASACCGTAQPQHFDLACGRRQQAAQHADGGGLAGAVGPEEAVDVRARHVEVDVVDRDQGAEALGQAARADREVVSGVAHVASLELDAHRQPGRQRRAASAPSSISAR